MTRRAAAACAGQDRLTGGAAGSDLYRGGSDLVTGLHQIARAEPIAAAALVADLVLEREPAQPEAPRAGDQLLGLSTPDPVRTRAPHDLSSGARVCLPAAWSDPAGAGCGPGRRRPGCRAARRPVSIRQVGREVKRAPRGRREGSAAGRSRDRGAAGKVAARSGSRHVLVHWIGREAPPREAAGAAFDAVCAVGLEAAIRPRRAGVRRAGRGPRRPRRRGVPRRAAARRRSQREPAGAGRRLTERRWPWVRPW